jgi:protein ImuA
MNAQTTLGALRRSLAAIQAPAMPSTGRISFGEASLDDSLGGGLARGRLHEVFAREPADASAAAGFALGLAMRAADGRRIVWIRQDIASVEAGDLHAPGLLAMGADPGAVILVQSRDAMGVLRAAAEAVRCCALGAVVIEPWGAPKALDLTATRRLALAVEKSGVTPFLLRAAAEPMPSAALTRWSVASAPSVAFDAKAPGPASFDVTLLRHRAGTAGGTWRLEWDHEHHLFREPILREHTALPRPLAPLPADRPLPADATVHRFRRAG